MTERLLKVLPLGLCGALLAILTAGVTPAQEPIPLRPPAQPAPPDPIPLPLPGRPIETARGDGIDVLAKGPVHEAFAATAEAPTASPVVAKRPPDPIEELPPDQKPEGDNVQWLPGYWHWDEEASKFIWISGCWRQPPPGRVWVPGAWREATGGWQWVSGFWHEVDARPQRPNQPEIEYLPPPPPSVESGPSVAAPDAESVYVPGSWVWRDKYVWRPGVWVGHRAGWVWAPARYHWTPAGCVFTDGYWDYPLADRGVLFAPVAFDQPVYEQPAFVFTPVYVVSEPCMVGALFVRRGHGHYYFGDYFEPGYAALGYSAWCGTYGRGGFSLGFGGGRNWGYDPLWSYYAVARRGTPGWGRGVGDLYHGRYRGDAARPPVTLARQNAAINALSRTNGRNATNDIAVVNGTPRVNGRDVSNVAMVAPLRAAPDLQQRKFQAVPAADRRTEAAASRQIRDLGTQRTRLETAAVNQPRRAAVQPAPGQPAVAAPPNRIKLDVPKAAVTRAQAGAERQAPPNPLRAATAGPGANADRPRDGQRPVANPQADPPRVGPRPTTPPPPKVDPRPQVNPPVTRPKSEPKPPGGAPVNPTPNVERPRVDPRPAVTPKADLPKTPAPPVTRPKADLPRPPVSVPRPSPQLVTPPRIDPRPLPPANPPPKSNPPSPPRPAVVNPPRVEPPRFNPPPRVEPPRPPVQQPKAPVVAPPVQRPRPPVPAAPRAEAPRVQPKAPVAAPPRPPVQPRPAVLAPPAQAPRAAALPRVQPPAAPPKVGPKAAPPGKLAPKGRDR